MTDMEAVNSFNAELQSLYEVKPPISKGKMTAVTRAALKGVKLYKHIVQSVEKFIQKCKTEYKIPGLYVIDSIIRQSRHQFGSEKDVFAPRFARNIQNTFMHLYKCPEEDKAKIIRVLNLWQRNKIFSPEVIQPLFDLADPNNPIWEKLTLQQEQNAKASGNSNLNSGGMSGGPSGMSSMLNNLPSVPFKKEILDYDYGDDDESGESRNQANPSSGDYNQNSNPHVGFDALGSILANPEILRQLATLQEQIAAATSQQPSSGGYPTPEQERQRKMAELNKQEAAFDQRLAQTVARLPFAVDCELPGNDDGRSPRKDTSVDQNSNQLSNHSGQPNQLLPPPFFQQINDQHQHNNQQSQQQQRQQQHQTLLNFLGQHQQDGQNPFSLPPMSFPPGVPFPPHQDLSQQMNMFNSQMTNEGNQGFSGFNQNQGPVEIDLTDDSKEKDRRDRRRKRSRERRSRSTSRSKPRRSRSRSRGRKRYRSRSRDRKEDKEREREKDKERTRKGLPPLKKEHLSVCSTTLWVGHLSKLVSQEELSDTFGAYGDIVSIDLIAPRGCAFIVMNRRQDSVRALDRLRNTKLQGKTITLAWAPGKGMKGRDWKDYWEVESGVSYIPWSKLRPETNLEEFEDGGCLDEDTLPGFLKNRPKVSDQDKDGPPESAEDSQDIPNISLPTNSQMPLMPTAPILGAMPDSVPKSGGDIDARMEMTMPNQGPMTGMPNAFGMPPPVGMMPMGMPVGMVPPPMMGPGMQAFHGMGIPMMGMMPPGLGVGPPMGGPGLLGDMPAAALANLQQQLNNSRMNLDSQSHNNDGGQLEEEDKRRNSDRRDGKRRSRFDDPDDKHSVMMEDVKNSPSQSQDQSKDDRPVFERLKSLADGYGFGGMNHEKAGPSLLGTPLMSSQSGVRGPGPGGDRMAGPRGFPQPLLSLGPGGGPNNQFGPRGPFMGERPPRVPGLNQQGQGMGGPRPWFEPSNPFLNPNPFAGNPFVQGNLTENPFEIGAPPRNDVDGNLSGPPGPLFGAGPSDRGGFAGRGRGGWSRDGPPPNRGGRGGRGGRDGNNWREEQQGGPPDRENSRDLDRDRGFRGRGRGRDARDSWSREREDRDRDRDRERDRERRDGRDNRDRSRDRGRDNDRRDRRDRSRDRDDRDNSRDNSFRDRRRRSNDGRRSSERQSQEKSKDESRNNKSQQEEEENWEDDIPAESESIPTEKPILPKLDENWEEESGHQQDIIPKNNETEEEPSDNNTVNEANNENNQEKNWETTENPSFAARQEQEEENISSYQKQDCDESEPMSGAAYEDEQEKEVESIPEQQHRRNSINYQRDQEENVQQSISQQHRRNSIHYEQRDEEEQLPNNNNEDSLQNEETNEQASYHQEREEEEKEQEEESSSVYQPEEEDSMNYHNDVVQGNLRSYQNREDSLNYELPLENQPASNNGPSGEHEEEGGFESEKPRQEDYEDSSSQPGGWVGLCGNNGDVENHNNFNHCENNSKDEEEHIESVGDTSVSSEQQTPYFLKHNDNVNHDNDEDNSETHNNHSGEEESESTQHYNNDDSSSIKNNSSGDIIENEEIENGPS